MSERLDSELRALRAADVFSALDEQLARALCGMVDERDARVLFAVALLSRHVAAGHVCLPLNELTPGVLAPEQAALVSEWPETQPWLAAVRGSALCAGDTSPLVLTPEGKLYLRRHFAAEQSLANLLRERAAQTLAIDRARVAARLVHHFGTDEVDLQRSAAELATQRALCVISGGPGTGKTSTVVKILAVAIEEALAAGQTAPRIGLVAPTGKAAVRLQAAVRGAKERLVCAPEVREAIPEEASTIHRVLAQRARSERYEPGALPEPLPLDLLLVDEASMVDLELMSALLAALPGSARIIMLGDRDQLASVEAGAVFGDICGVSAQRDAQLAGCIVQLTRSYRYAADSGIGRLARAVQAGDAVQALAILDDPAYPDVQLDESEPLNAPESAFARTVSAGFAPYLRAGADALAALQAFDRFRVLCAHRQGERGVLGLNRQIARVLDAAGLLDTRDHQYLGRPVLVTENDYRNRLWNGDIGIVLAGDAGRFAHFLEPDGSLRQFGLGRLPPHESAFALSVHKSQGSEVDEVALVLPDEASRVLSRELIYTALTRAKKRVLIYGKRAVLQTALAQVVERSTGLRELLSV